MKTMYKSILIFLIFISCFCKQEPKEEEVKTKKVSPVSLQNAHPTTQQIVRILRENKPEELMSFLDTTYSFEIDEWYIALPDGSDHGAPPKRKDFLKDGIKESAKDLIFKNEVMQKEFQETFPGIVSFREAFMNPKVEISDYFKMGDYGYIGIDYGNYIYSIDLSCDKNGNCKIIRFGIGRK
ncbi:putative lipoprotein [Leptospira weilii str. 2006001853]|uniref:Putative lipoprotein n=1 Tax=Leptospira weilii str. 2006001853 TaxID=1001589 RepID=A0A828ZAZ5_9LEPT|nr:hypothetical protein [Leptospira weilii]EKR66574.1 putative lipoprotein [Leptospira weilii str. 2006001853]EMN44289.1 putative lipoprotein [Leptospira weilii str. LNT 1234]QDK24649.1 hypothetical protein FHG67_01820 [Leptospira weilii]QDK28604.1 hypothetical protein FHG68_01830 [Leptospira weilii]